MHLAIAAPETERREFADLSPPQQFLLWGLRVGLLTDLSPQEACGVLSCGFRHAGISFGLPPFLALISVTAAVFDQAPNAPDVRCPYCSSIGRDEWRLVQAIAAVQRGDRQAAEMQLLRLMPGTGVQVFLGCAYRLTKAFQAAGWLLADTQRNLESGQSVLRQMH